MRELISEYRALTDKITRLEEKIESIYSAAASPGIKTITDMPMAPGFSGSGLEDTFIRIEKIEERIAEYKKERADIAARIETKLDLAGVSGTIRVVFWYREVRGMKWRHISMKTGKSIRTLQRISQKAIYMSLLL
jgi:hypothetical protein